MSFNHSLPVDIELAIGVERGTKFPHWMLMLRHQNAPTGTWYHSTGGPSQNRPYKLEIQGGKRSNSRGIQSLELLGTISGEDVKKVTAAAKRVQPQQCQTFVVSMVYELERKNMVPPGTTQALASRVKMSSLAWDFAQQNPVPTPPGIRFPQFPNLHPQAGSSSQAGHGAPQSTSVTQSAASRTHNQQPTGLVSHPAQQQERRKEPGCGCIIM
jgi:hypothetical protein